MDFCVREPEESRKKRRHIRTHSYVKTHLKRIHTLCNFVLDDVICMSTCLSMRAREFILYAWAKRAQQSLLLISMLLYYSSFFVHFHFHPFPFPFRRPNVNVVTEPLFNFPILHYAIALYCSLSSSSSLFFLLRTNLPDNCYWKVAIFPWKKKKPDWMMTNAFVICNN